MFIFNLKVIQRILFGFDITEGPNFILFFQINSGISAISRIRCECQLTPLVYKPSIKCFYFSSYYQPMYVTRYGPSSRPKQAFFRIEKLSLEAINFRNGQFTPSSYLSRLQSYEYLCCLFSYVFRCSYVKEARTTPLPAITLKTNCHPFQ